MRLPRFRLITLMFVVAILAMLLVEFRPSLSWWGVKPLMYFVLIPVVAATLAMRDQHRFVIVLATAVNTLLLLAWYELRRPLEGILIGGEDPEYVRDMLALCYYTTLYRGMTYTFHWVVRKGTFADLLWLMGSMLMLMAMLVRPVSFRARISGALSLTLLAIYGWATSKRWGGSDDSFDWLAWSDWSFGDKTPIHLSQHWLRQWDTLSILWRAIGVVRALELLVLAIVVASLIAVGLHAVLIHETRPSGPTHV